MEKTLTPDAIHELDLVRIATAINSLDIGQIAAEHARTKAFLDKYDDGATWPHIIAVRVIERHLAELAKGKGHRERALSALKEALGTFMRPPSG